MPCLPLPLNILTSRPPTRGASEASDISQETPFSLLQIPPTHPAPQKLPDGLLVSRCPLTVAHHPDTAPPEAGSSCSAFPEITPNLSNLKRTLLLAFIPAFPVIPQERERDTVSHQISELPARRVPVDLLHHQRPTPSLSSQALLSGPFLSHTLSTPHPRTSGFSGFLASKPS